MDRELEMQRYLFDLAGFMVIPEVLDRSQVAALNRLIDARQLPPPREKIRFGQAAGGAPACPGFLDWGQPFCDLLDHPRIMPLLRLTLGEWFRLDRLYGINMEAGMEGGELHGGNAPYSPAEYYHVRDGRIHNAFTVVSWNLTDAGPEHGGFCCVPGSHKSNFIRPDAIPTVNQGRWKLTAGGDALAPGVVVPEAPAGSVVLFSEALTHGTAPWTAAHRRRTLLYKYCQSHLAWSARRVRPPAAVPLTPHQQILFGEPANPGTWFASLFPEAAASGTGAPKTAAPEAPALEAGAPEAAAPKTVAPEAGASETAAPARQG